MVVFFFKCLLNTSNSFKVDNTKRDVIASNTLWRGQSIKKTGLFRNVKHYCTELYLVHICTVMPQFLVTVPLMHYICYHHCIHTVSSSQSCCPIPT